MIGLLVWIPVGAIAFVAAGWLHELVHAAAVRALGGDVLDVDLWQLHVDYSFGSEEMTWRDDIVLFAPTAVGVAALPALLWRWSGALTPPAAITAIAWLLFMRDGGRDVLARS